MANESGYERNIRIKKEQKARYLKKQEENKKKSSEDDIVKVRAKKSKSSKLGSGASSSGSSNPTSKFQEKNKAKDNKSTPKGEKAYAAIMKMMKSKGKASANEMKRAGPIKSASSVKVKSGNNLSTIAQKAGITLKQLLAANPKYAKNPNKLGVGDTVKIPAVSKKKGSVYEGTSKTEMAKMAMKNGGMTTKKKTKYMAKGGMKKTKYMAKGGAAKRK